MRLINVHSLELASFGPGSNPLYAVASHRWRDGAELTLQDIQSKRNTECYGHQKLEKFAAFVRDHVPGVDWLWIDTCCIDKTSSQELQEAITAMYRWYAESTVCLAFLGDVTPAGHADELRRAVWFTRGWTLQELLAPRLVVFLAGDWTVLGHKGQEQGGQEQPRSIPIGPQLNELIADVTGIPKAVLSRPELRKALSVEHKLGWMANRTTTRPEDIAYSLLGIFEVSMPLIYEEGAVAANRRLIRAIEEAHDEHPRQSSKDVSDVPNSKPASIQVPCQPLPSSTVPFRRDPDFVPRPELEELEQKLSTAAARVALVGLGGVGKSQLVIECCYRAQDKSPDQWILWAHSSSVARLDESIRKLANDVRIPDIQDAMASVYQQVYNWLRDSRNGKWILVLDSADEAGFLFEPPDGGEGGTQDGGVAANGGGRARLDFFPVCNHGSVVITSRNQALASKITDDRDVIAVQPMDQERAVDLLQKKLGERQSDSLPLEKLVTALEYMPLAISQAAAYIKKRQPRCSVEQYLSKFEKSDKSRTSLLDTKTAEPRRDIEAESSVMLTWQISFEHIYQIKRSAADLLSLMSFFDYHSIPEFVLRCKPTSESQSLRPPSERTKQQTASADEDSSNYSDSSEDEAFEDDILTLRDYHFISVNDVADAFAMHRLVQLAMRKWLQSQGRFQEWVKKTTENLYTTLPNGSVREWEKCRLLYPHVRLALNLKPEGEIPNRQWAAVMWRAAFFQLQQGSPKDAEAFARQSRDVRAKYLGENHERTIASTIMLATTLLSQSRFEAAEIMSRQALELSEQALGQEHSQTFDSLSVLGVALREQGKLAEAEEMSRRCLQAATQHFGESTSQALTSKGNLGLILLSQGRYQEAEEMHRQCVEISKTVFGEESPYSLTNLSNLARSLQSQGKLAAAEELNRQVLKARERVLGESHTDTLSSMANLAAVLLGMGKYQESEELNRRAVKGKEEALGKEHIETILAVSNLSTAIRLQGRYEEAATMLQDALDNSTRVQGEDHPCTLSVENNLAVLHLLQNKPEAAEKLIRRVQRVRQRTLGEDHPDTQLSTGNVALLLRQQENFEESETMYREVIEKLKQVLGEEHPHTLTAMEDLSHLIEDQGRFEEAEDVSRHVLEAREKVLGREHIETLRTMYNLAQLLWYQDKAGPEELLRRILQVDEQTLGEEHPDTLDRRDALGVCLHDKGRNAEAEEVLRRTFDVRKRVQGDQHEETLGSLKGLILVLLLQGKDEEAAEMCKLGDQDTQVPGEKRPGMISSLLMLAFIRHAKRKLAECVALAERAYADIVNLISADHPDAMKVHEALTGLRAKASHQEAVYVSCRKKSQAE